MSTIIGTFFAIRERGTLKYLPENYGRGYTHTEPVAGPQPRLLHSHKAAHLALTAWCKGRATVHHGGHLSFDGYDEADDLKYTPVEGRSKDKMEIIELQLVLP